MPAVDAVILDLGNVLVFHDNAYLFRRFADLAGLKGGADELTRRLPSDLWERINRGQLHGDAIRRAICEPIGLDLSPEYFFALWNCHFRVHDEVLPLIDALLGRVKVGLLSNTNDLHAEFLLPQLPILKRFDTLVLSNEVKLAKPDAAIFETALQRLAVPAGRAAFFDDIQEYVSASAKVGIHGRLFTTAESFRRQLAELGL